MLKHSIPLKTHPFSTYCRILEASPVELRNSPLCFALLPERENENIKDLIRPTGNRTHNSRVYNKKYLQKFANFILFDLLLRNDKQIVYYFATFDLIYLYYIKLLGFPVNYCKCWPYQSTSIINMYAIE